MSAKSAAKLSAKSPAATLAEPSPEAAFAITARQPSRPARALKYGDTFIVLDGRGDIGGISGGPDGLFHQRHALSLAARIAGERRAAAVARLQPARRQFGAFRRSDQSGSYCRPAHRAAEGHACTFCARSFCGADDRLSAAGVRNYGDRAIDLQLSILFDNDFADLFEVRGAHRERRGSATATAARRRPGAVELSRARRQGAAHHAHLRSAARSILPPTTAILRSAPRPGRDAPALPRRRAAIRPRRVRCRSCAA